MGRGEGQECTQRAAKYAVSRSASEQADASAPAELTPDEREARKASIMAELLTPSDDGESAAGGGMQDGLMSADLDGLPLNIVGIGVVLDALFGEDGAFEVGDDRRYAEDALKAMEDANLYLPDNHKLGPDDLPDFFDDDEFRRGITGRSDDPRVRESYDEDGGTWGKRTDEGREGTARRIREGLERDRADAAAAREQDLSRRERELFERELFEREQDELLAR